MRTTTVTWRKGHVSPEDLEAKRQRMYNAAFSIAGELYRETINQTSNTNDESITVTRAWPDAEKAQAWVDYVLSEGADSAQVDPE
jgi:cation transport regulator ChaB